MRGTEKGESKAHFALGPMKYRISFCARKYQRPSVCRRKKHIEEASAIF